MAKRPKLIIEGTVRPGVYKCSLKGADRAAMAVIHICNGRACVGFDEAAPDPEVEAVIVQMPERKLGRLVAQTKGLA